MTKQYKAAESIADHVFVKFDSNGGLVACAAGDQACGIIQASTPKIGEGGQVAIEGVCKVKLGEAVVAGQFVTPGASGKAVVVTNESFIGAQCLESGAAGDVVDVRYLGNVNGEQTVEVTLTLHSGASNPETPTSSPVIHLRKVGKTVFCSIDHFEIPSFAGTNEVLKTQACIPAAFRPYDDWLTFPSVMLSPAQPACWAPFLDGHIEFYKDATFAGFGNGDDLQFITMTAVWMTA